MEKVIVEYDNDKVITYDVVLWRTYKKGKKEVLQQNIPMFQFIYIFGFYTRLTTYPVGTKQLPNEEKTYKTTKHSSLLQFFLIRSLADFQKLGKIIFKQRNLKTSV